MTPAATKLYDGLVGLLTGYRREERGQLGAQATPVSRPGAQVLVGEMLAMLAADAEAAGELLGLTIFPNYRPRPVLGSGPATRD